MTLTPPAHICGQNLTRGARAERHRWINSLPETFSARQVANALGITSDVVRFAAPGRFTRIPQAVAPTSRHVSLPPVPGIEITRARPETSPRAGIVSPERKLLSIEERIEVIRQMWIKTRVAA